MQHSIKTWQTKIEYNLSDTVTLCKTKESFNTPITAYTLSQKS